MRTSGAGLFSLFPNWTINLLVSLFFGGIATTLSGQPANDHFANRIPIAIGSTNFSGNLSNATAEAFEPLHSGISTDQTAWWTWIAPSNGILELRITATSFHPFVTVHTGGSLETLSLIASNSFLSCYDMESCGCHWRMRNHASFHVAQGQAYQISVDSALLTDTTLIQQPPLNFTSWFEPFQPLYTTNVIPGNEFQIGLQFTPAPANDDFENRQTISGSRKQLYESNRGATSQLNEPHSPTGGSSIWYSWKAPASGRVTLSTANMAPYEPPSWYAFGMSSSFIGVSVGGWVSIASCGNEIDQNPPPPFFPLFAAYTGFTLDTLVSANSVPIGMAEYPHAIAFDAVKGQTYQLAFDGNQGTTGHTPLYLALTKPAANDHFRNRIITRGIYVAASGFNAGATRENSEELVGSNTLGKTVWWTWTAPVSGVVNIELLENENDHQFPVGVFTGSTLASLNLIANGTGATSFEAIAGHRYHVAVSDLNGRTGSILCRIAGPLVEALHRRTIQTRKTTLISFAALKGQKLLLQKSEDNVEWRNIQSSVAHNNGVSFVLKRNLSDATAHYRAIIVDWVR
jgi:hypothetical protein